MNVTSLIVCVVAPNYWKDSKSFAVIAEAESFLRAKKAAVLTPAVLPYALGDSQRLDIAQAMVRSSNVLALMPGWGNCKACRAAWALAEALGMSQVFIDRGLDGALTMSALEGLQQC